MRVTHLNYCSNSPTFNLCGVDSRDRPDWRIRIGIRRRAKAYDSHPRPIQNLRSTSRGGHIALVDVAKAQLDPPMGKLISSFDRMRSQRNVLEYRSYEMPEITKDDVMSDSERANEIIEMVKQTSWTDARLVPILVVR